MRYKPIARENKLLKEVLSDPESRAIYEATKLQIRLAMELKKARKKKKLSQEEVAEIMQTRKPAISRLESGNDVKNFPSLLTIVKFASAVGYEIKIALVPIKKLRK